MAESWYYVVGGASRGPVEREALQKKALEGEVQRATLVWREGLGDWVSAGDIEFLFPRLPSVPPPPIPPPVPTGTQAHAMLSAVAAQGAPQAAPAPATPAAGPQQDAKGMFGAIGARISNVADLPTLSNLNVKELLIGGLHQKTGEEEIEETFAVGTRKTTPPLSEVPAGWPAPRVFWRVLMGCVAAYVLMRIGLTSFKNVNFYPGLLVVGSFMVPLACVILFFEFNTPKNVSIYQVAKLLLIGGALSIVLTLTLFEFISGAGTGQILPAMLTGVGEETGKALVLLAMVRSPRYPWQLNGMLFGAAVGAGFAGFESAGYAYRAGAGLFDSIMLRAILAPGGHVIWTAMIGAAIWRVKGNKKFEAGMLFHPIVIRRWGIAVVLHGLWDSSILTWYIQLPILSVVGWYLILAMLKQAYGGLDQVRESLAAGAAGTSGTAA